MGFLWCNTGKIERNEPRRPGFRVGEALARSMQEGFSNTRGRDLRKNFLKNLL